MTQLAAERADHAVDWLYRSHRADVYRYALALLSNPADAEDATQTAFMNAFRALRRGERPRAPRNWLIAIAHNVCRQRFRQSARRPSEVEFDESFAEAASDEEQWSAHDIRRALSHLGFNQRAALVLREVEGRSYAEIGDILGLSLPAVEALVFRARRALREQLEGGLSCAHARRAIAQQLDGRLARAERGELRAHLRACRDCATLAKSRRGRARTLGGLASLLPFPLPLKSLFGGPSGAAAAAGGTGSAVAGKAAAVALVALVASGAGYRGFEGLGRGPERHAAAAPAEHDAPGDRSGFATAGASPGPLASRPPGRGVVSSGPAASAYRAVPLWRGGWGSDDPRPAHVTGRSAPDADEVPGGPKTPPGRPVPEVAKRQHLVEPPATTEPSSAAAAVTTGAGSSWDGATPAAGPGGPHPPAPSASDTGASATVEHTAAVAIPESLNGESQGAVAGEAVAASEETVPVERAAGSAQAVPAHVAPPADKDDKPSPEKSEKPKADKDDKPSPEKSEKPKAVNEDKPSPEKSEKPKAVNEDKPSPEKSEMQSPVKAEQSKSEKNDKREDAKPAPDKGEKPAPGSSEGRKADTSEKPKAEKTEKVAPEKADKPSSEKDVKPEKDEKATPEQSAGAGSAVPAADAPGPVG